jgi:hypothetical protein
MNVLWQQKCRAGQEQLLRQDNIFFLYFFYFAAPATGQYMHVCVYMYVCIYMYVCVHMYVWVCIDTIHVS